MRDLLSRFTYTRTRIRFTLRNVDHTYAVTQRDSEPESWTPDAGLQTPDAGCRTSDAHSGGE